MGTNCATLAHVRYGSLADIANVWQSCNHTLVIPAFSGLRPNPGLLRPPFFCLPRFDANPPPHCVTNQCSLRGCTLASQRIRDCIPSSTRPLGNGGATIEALCGGCVTFEFIQSLPPVFGQQLSAIRDAAATA